MNIDNNQSNQYAAYSLRPHYYSYEGRLKKKKKRTSVHLLTHQLSLSKELYEIKTPICIITYLVETGVG